TAALTLGLIVSALMGPGVGRMLDAHGPRPIMGAATAIGVIALALVAIAPNLFVFFLAWVLAGFAQAGTLYPPAFAVLTRWYGAAAAREQKPSPAELRRVARAPRLLIVQAAVAIATFTLFAVTINIIPLISARGAGYGLAAVALGRGGFGQVAGRFGYPSLERHTSTRLRTVILFAAGAVGLWLLALVPGPTWLLIGIGMVAGAVRGCMTLLQATAVSDRWGTNNFGAVNGVFVAPITAGTALAPVAGPALAGVLGGYPMMAVAMAGLLS